MRAVRFRQLDAGHLVGLGLVECLPLEQRVSQGVEAPSLDMKEKVAPVVFAGLAGLPVIVVFGAAVSTVQANEAGERSVLPAASVARTSKVWVPCVSPVNVFVPEVPEPQEANRAMSIRHE